MPCLAVSVPLLLLLLLLLPPPAAAASLNDTAAAAAHDVLSRYSLPEGLLPDAVASFSLGEDGRFAVELDRPSCYVQFGPYLVHYGRQVTGAIGKGSVRDLEGIQVQRLFLWLGVGVIKVDAPAADAVYFEIGWITGRLPVEEFRRVHSCLDRATYRERIKGLFPEPLYEIEELITGDVHVSL